MIPEKTIVILIAAAMYIATHVSKGHPTVECSVEQARKLVREVGGVA